MTAIAAFAAFGAIWLLGALALSTLGLRPDRGVSAVVIDYVAGAVIVAFLGVLMVVLGFRLTPAPAYVLLFGFAIAAGAQRRWLQLRPAWPRDPVAIALLVLAALVVVVLMLSAARDRLWWDGWAIWLFKARILFLEGTIPAHVLDPRAIYRFTNPDYPLGAPLLSWWLFAHAGAIVPGLASIAGALWFAAIPVLMFSGLRGRTGPRVAAVAALACAAFWPLPFFAAGGTPDIAIAVALLGAVIHLERGFRTGRGVQFWRAGLFLALGSLHKHEGLALAIVAAVVVVGAMALQRRWHRAALGALLLPFVALAPWSIFSHSLGLRTQVMLQVASMAPGAAAASEGILARNVRLMAAGWVDLLRLAIWLPLPFLALAGGVAALRRRAVGVLVAWGVVAGYAGAVKFAYIMIPDANGLAWLLATSFPRVFAALVPALVFTALISVSSSLPALPKEPNASVPT